MNVMRRESVPPTLPTARLTHGGIFGRRAGGCGNRPAVSRSRPIGRNATELLLSLGIIWLCLVASASTLFFLVSRHVAEGNPAGKKSSS